MLDRAAHEGVSGLMIGDALLLLRAHAAAVLFQTEHDSVYGLFQVPLLDSIRSAARGQQGGFVDDIRQVGADHSRRTGRYRVKVDAGRKLDLGGVNPPESLP